MGQGIKERRGRNNKDIQTYVTFSYNKTARKSSKRKVASEREQINFIRLC